MEFVFAILGFSLAAYSVVGNDSIQTLGTFLSSNAAMKWWKLWMFAGGILLMTLVLGYLGLGELLGGENAQDLTFGKFEKVFPEGKPFPQMSIWYVLPPLVLLFITRLGLPVSTTFLVLSFFSIESLPKMLSKSLAGYGVAFLFALAIYLALSRLTERYFLLKPMQKGRGLMRNLEFWTALQWISTAFLWSQWLTQDLVNILIYLGPPQEIELPLFLLATVILVGLLGVIMYQRGGKIQEIVLAKTNTTDIRSATFIDFFYALVLLLFKYDTFGIWSGGIPMSTTWVFLGLLAGREIAIRHRLSIGKKQGLASMVFADLGKATVGLVVSVLLVVVLYVVQGKPVSAMF
jgi:hypothetical protein